MKHRPRIPLLLVLAVLFLSAGVFRAQAVIRIYKVTFKGTALLNPKVNNISVTGYVVYDTAAPGNSATIELLSGKRYQVNGGMQNIVVPTAINFLLFDRNGDTFTDTEAAVNTFNTAGATSVRSYLGTVPKAGFRVGAITVVGTAKSLKGKGSVAANGPEYFTVADTWTFDPLAVTGNAGNTAAGVALVQARLQTQHYTQIP